jgi:hypothetical protein
MRTRTGYSIIRQISWSPIGRVTSTRTLEEEGARVRILRICEVTVMLIDRDTNQSNAQFPLVRARG